MSALAFVDTETTGLDSEVHEIWEVGLIVRPGHKGRDEEYRWCLPVDVHRADPKALEIGRFYERYSTVTEVDDFVDQFADLTKGTHLVGAVVSFDEERLRKMLLAHNRRPKWHYHLVDVEALVAGKLGTPPPWDSNLLSREFGVDPTQFDRHTALGDAAWARALYDEVMA